MESLHSSTLLRQRQYEWDFESHVWKDFLVDWKYTQEIMRSHENSHLLLLHG